MSVPPILVIAYAGALQVAKALRLPNVPYGIFKATAMSVFGRFKEGTFRDDLRRLGHLREQFVNHERILFFIPKSGAIPLPPSDWEDQFPDQGLERLLSAFEQGERDLNADHLLPKKGSSTLSWKQLGSFEAPPAEEPASTTEPPQEPSEETLPPAPPVRVEPETVVAPSTSAPVIQKQKARHRAIRINQSTARIITDLRTLREALDGETVPITLVNQIYDRYPEWSAKTPYSVRGSNLEKPGFLRRVRNQDGSILGFTDISDAPFELWGDRLAWLDNIPPLTLEEARAMIHSSASTPSPELIVQSVPAPQKAPQKKTRGDGRRSKIKGKIASPLTARILEETRMLRDLLDGATVPMKAVYALYERYPVRKSHPWDIVSRLEKQGLWRRVFGGRFVEGVSEVYDGPFNLRKTSSNDLEGIPFLSSAEALQILQGIQTSKAVPLAPSKTQPPPSPDIDKPALTKPDSGPEMSSLFVEDPPTDPPCHYALSLLKEERNNLATEIARLEADLREARAQLASIDVAITRLDNS